jgi:hypothetical protein
MTDVPPWRYVAEGNHHLVFAPANRAGVVLRTVKALPGEAAPRGGALAHEARAEARARARKTDTWQPHLQRHARFSPVARPPQGRVRARRRRAAARAPLPPGEPTLVA